jgi:hypothetical protein
VESTVRYLGIEVDDALAIAEQIDVISGLVARRPFKPMPGLGSRSSSTAAVARTRATS